MELSVHGLDKLTRTLGESLHGNAIKKLFPNIANVYHLVYSSTVLGYFHKLDAKLKPFKVLFSVIQTAGTFEEGRLCRPSHFCTTLSKNKTRGL